MPPHPQWIAIAVFAGFFLFVTIAGFFAAQWHGGFRRHATGLARVAGTSLDEWGLGGRRFGTLITWFLMGGDLYTAYTIIAVPALVYGTGAPAFFAIPYAALGYPVMLLVMPRFWRMSREGGYVTLADFARGIFNNRWLTLAVALTGLLATMPYIALQLVGMEVALGALGLRGEVPLVVAFIVLAAYTYTSGLRAPALISIVKDAMLYIMVIAAVVIIPLKLGGYAHIFAAAGVGLAKHTPPASLLLQTKQYLPYSTLAIGSMLALMLYPHNITGYLAASSERAIQRNAALLPAYNLLLGLIALLGYVAIAAGVHSASPNGIVPALFVQMFPQWFSGFCLAAIGIGALVPAAIMSIAAANLVTRNLVGEFRRRPLSHQNEARLAKFVSIAVKFGALAFVLASPTAYAIQLQLLGGIWMVQLLPSFLSGLYRRRTSGFALFSGWAAGMLAGTWMAVEQHLKASVYPLHIGGHVFAMYAAVPALLLNIALAATVELAMSARKNAPGAEAVRA